MKRIKLLFLLLITVCSNAQFVSGQMRASSDSKAQLVSNVRAMQQDTTLVIVYDLHGPATTKLQVSFDGGNTFVPASSVTGDIGKTAAGSNRIVYWNASKDAGYFDCDKMVFKVIASGRIQNTVTSTAATGHELVYIRGGVFQNGQNITREYKSFLQNNCPEAYRAYKKRWNGMFWGGMATTLLSVAFIGGALGIAIDGSSNEGFGIGAFSGLAGLCFFTGIPIMCCSTISARKYSVKAYNNSCGLLDVTAFDGSLSTEVPLQLSLQSSSQGLGLALQF